MHTVIFGCGFSGTAIAGAFSGTGNTVVGTSRSAENVAALEQQGIRALRFDGETLEPTLLDEMKQATHLIQSIAPGRPGDPVIRLAGERISALMPKLQWIGYLSTIGVYGDHGGAWIDEDAAMNSASGRSAERVVAEKEWMALGQSIGVPVAVLRLSGIYGPGRNAFCNIEKGTARRIIKADQIFNRIRVEDIGAASRFLADGALGGIYNVTDDEPAPPQDVILEAARLMGVEPPPKIPFETADLTPMARSFYGENKRVSNARIKALGFRFSYPNYLISLADLWREGRWRG